jgi:hypothetical protein
MRKVKLVIGLLAFGAAVIVALDQATPNKGIW